MNSFDTYLLKRIYKKIAKLGDKLAEADNQIDWTAFRPIIKDLYRNDTERGGRPNADEVVMIKLLVLQQWFGLSDEEVERQANDGISFQRFLGYQDLVPDSTARASGQSIGACIQTMMLKAYGLGLGTL